MSKTIVHADDSAAVRHWVAEQLNDLNLRVVSVSDGEAALSLLANRTVTCCLPIWKCRISTASRVSAVRELPAHRFLPVLVLSCRHPSEFEAHRRQGVTGWMVKPIDAEHLRRWVRRVLPE